MAGISKPVAFVSTPDVDDADDDVLAKMDLIQEIRQELDGVTDPEIIRRVSNQAIRRALATKKDPNKRPEAGVQFR